MWLNVMKLGIQSFTDFIHIIKLLENQIIKCFGGEFNRRSSKIFLVIEAWMCSYCYLMFQTKFNGVTHCMTITCMISTRNVRAANEWHDSRIERHAFAHIAVYIDAHCIDLKKSFNRTAQVT